ncbi:MAG: cell division protein SepF [bacterium]
MSRIGLFFKRVFGLIDEEEMEELGSELKESGNVFPISGKGKKSETVTIFIYGLSNFDDIQRVADEVKKNKIVVVNFEETSKEEAIRALDFISGAVYALEGSLQKVGEYVFLAIPKGIGIEGTNIGQNPYPIDTSKI